VDFLPNAEQGALANATREYIASRLPLAEVLTRLDDVRWKEIAELGWLGLAVGEEAGGAGGSLIDEVFLHREIGRGLVCGPVLTTAVAARLAGWTGQPSLATDLVIGQIRVARAIPLPGAADQLLILDPEGSVLTMVMTDEQVALYCTPHDVRSTPGLEDATMVGHVRVAELGETIVSTDDRQLMDRTRRVLTILTSAQLAGIAAATRDSAVEHAKSRVQFGKPIGAFQAIKHKCADMATNALAADNVTYFAALTEMDGAAKSDYHALAAAAYCRRVAFSNARTNIQIHGAMGFTVEDTAHRFLKRTHTLCATEAFDRAAGLLGALPTPENSEGT